MKKIIDFFRNPIITLLYVIMHSVRKKCYVKKKKVLYYNSIPIAHASVIDLKIAICLSGSISNGISMLQDL